MYVSTSIEGEFELIVFEIFKPCSSTYNKFASKYSNVCQKKSIPKNKIMYTFSKQEQQNIFLGKGDNKRSHAIFFGLFD